MHLDRWWACRGAQTRPDVSTAAPPPPRAACTLQSGGEASTPMDQRKGCTDIRSIAQYFVHPISDAARMMSICPTVLKKICRRHNIHRWPQRKVRGGERRRGPPGVVACMDSAAWPVPDAQGWARSRTRAGEPGVAGGGVVCAWAGAAPPGSGTTLLALSCMPTNRPVHSQLKSIEKRVQELLSRAPETSSERSALEIKMEELQGELQRLTCGQLTLSGQGIVMC